MAMNVLVVGSGAREHALAWACAKSPLVATVFVAPGNGGTAMGHKMHNMPIAASDTQALVTVAKEHSVSLCVIGPDQALADGLGDAMRAASIPCFGHTRAASKIEWSKAFAKTIMASSYVPTAQHVVVQNIAEIADAVATFEHPPVVKVDGLAAGKGVVVAQTHEEAIEAATNALNSGAEAVVIEECLTGREVSLLAVVNGRSVQAMLPARDYKRRFDGDLGPNTGGMGSFAPLGDISPELRQAILRDVLLPVADVMADLNTPLQGCLYAGLMVGDDNSLSVLEFNARFGDPECQALMPLVSNDIVPVLCSVAEGHDAVPPMEFSSKSAVGVVLCDEPYPSKRPIDSPISLPSPRDDVEIFHAATALKGDVVVQNGGRVLSVVGLGDDVSLARQAAYRAAQDIEFEGRAYRSDIAE